jgi:O-antigen/teichoic acid export membrane protein
VSRLRGEGNLSAIPNVLVTAGRITLIAGLAGGALIALAALWGAATWVEAATTPRKEISMAIFLLAIALPAQAMSATYRGMNDAFLNFKGVNLLRIGLGAVNFGGPYLVSLYTTELPWLVATLVASRLIALAVYRWLAYSCLDDWNSVKTGPAYSAAVAKSLFSFGGWITVSSVVSPMLVQADRFLIASVLSATAVTAYVLPYEVVVQSLILVGAVSSVMFPTLSRLMREEPNGWQRYFRRWLLMVAGMMFLACTAIALLLPDVLRLWLKDALQPESILVGQILCLGVFANSIGSMYYALLHAKGRADLTAKLHMIELPLFVIALFFLLHQYGISGAAWAWVGRMVFDSVALAGMARFMHA